MKKRTKFIMVVALLMVVTSICIAVSSKNSRFADQETDRQALLHMGDSVNAASDALQSVYSMQSDIDGISARRDMINAGFQNALTQSEREYWLEELRKLNAEIDEKYGDTLPDK